MSRLSYKYASIALLVGRIASAFAAVLVGMMNHAQAANIVVVTNDTTGAAPLTSFLTAEGHTVATGAFGAAPPDAAMLAANDLIIMSREANSGDYDDGNEEVLWNGLTLPMISLNAFVERGGTGTNQRWHWVNGNARVNLAVGSFDPYPNTSHAFLTGVTSTTILNSPATFGDNALVATQALPAGSTVVATANSGGAYGLYHIPAGASAFAEQGTFGADRAAFVVGTFANISDDGKQILRNIIGVFTTPLLPGDVNGDGFVLMDDFDIIRANFRRSPRARNEGDLTGDSLVSLFDFVEWKTEFLNGGGSLTGVDFGFLSVPEPSSVLLAMATMLGLVGCRWPRRRC